MPTVPASHAEALRSFNRFYTRHIGVLDQGLLDSPYTLAQARVLYELAQRRQAIASEIGQALGLDPGYLSRIVRGFVAEGLVTRKPSAQDRRRVALALTAAGRRAFARLDRRSHDQASTLLADLSSADRQRLLGNLRTARRLLEPKAVPDDGIVIRESRPGDMGWAIQRHAELYTEEYGWNAEFETLVANLFAHFASRHDPASERFWIAELHGERVGCVFMTRNEDDASVAQLRCLLVDPAGRGHGVGRRLVEQCLAFAREAGYPKIRLWTNDVLTAARRIYQATGFELVREYQHRSFGKDLVGQIWERAL